MSAGGLRFLADESCDYAVVRALREKGYDVLAVCEYASRSVDSDLMIQAYHEHRILLTEDKDFGWLAYVSHLDSAGVILIRFPGNVRNTLTQSILKLVQENGDNLVDAFTVVQPGYIRVSHRAGDTE
jgi:predicted nuclease of predicted toxin-antitoxin system